MPGDEVKPALGWRGAPLTIGALLLLVGGLTWVVTTTIQGQGMINEAATKAATQALERHTIRPIDVAHADVPKLYTTQAEFRLVVQGIQGDIRAIRQSQTTTAEAIKQLTAQVSRGNRHRGQ